MGAKKGMRSLGLRNNLLNTSFRAGRNVDPESIAFDSVNGWILALVPVLWVFAGMTSEEAF